MLINPRSNILVVNINNNTETDDDIATVSDDDQKTLVTCTVLESSSDGIYGKGDIVIVGRYSLYKLMYKGSDYFFLDKDDIIGTIEENV